ncbi:MAG: DUF4846 domain-containing protein [Flavobacteriales bacterium]|nr:DUF4846 domain-containing protein [Flavobacteriales bacterium]
MVKLISIVVVILTSTISLAQNYFDVQKMPFNDRPVLDSFKYEFPWLSSYQLENTIINRIRVPSGYERYTHKPGTFGHWLQRLPLKSGNPKVFLYNGQPKWNQNAHCYVVDIETGTKDLQQCADALMRLRAEYLYSNGQQDNIHFKYTNGATVTYKKWREGYMPVPGSGTVQWVKSDKAGTGYKKFKDFLIQVYNYAGTHSLDKELTKLNFRDMEPGDIIIEGGFPGHGIIVVDMAVNRKTGEKLFLLAQSYMPAQDIQILRNPNNVQLSPWYSLSEIDYIVDTPEWEFDTDDLRRWN